MAISVSVAFGDLILPMSRRRWSAERVLRALAEPQRLTILTLVRSRELRAGDIARHFRTTRSSISQHLRVLTEAGLLSQRQQGTSRLYRVRHEGFSQLRAFLDSLGEPVNTVESGGRRGR